MPITRKVLCFLTFLILSLLYFWTVGQNGKIRQMKWLTYEKFLVYLGKILTTSNKASQQLCKSADEEKYFNKSTILYFGGNAKIAKRYNEDRQMLEKYKCPEGDGFMRRFPQILIIGIAKCGTYALRIFLEHHPSICGAMKNTFNFLVGDEFNISVTKDPNYGVYLPMMKCSKWDQMTLVRTSQHTPNILLFDPCMKLIVAVKDPVHRVISHFLHYSSKNASVGFMKTVFGTNNTPSGSHWVSASMYNVYLKQLLAYFPQQQIHIVDGSLLVTDPFVEMVKLERFLNIPSFYKNNNFVFNEEKGYFCFAPEGDDSNECMRSGKGRTKPQESLEEMLGHYVSKDVNTTEVVHRLKAFFKPHMKEFYELAQRTFSWQD